MFVFFCFSFHFCCIMHARLENCWDKWYFLGHFFPLDRSQLHLLIQIATHFISQYTPPPFYEDKEHFNYYISPQNMMWFMSLVSLKASQWRRKWLKHTHTHRRHESWMPRACCQDHSVWEINDECLVSCATTCLSHKFNINSRHFMSQIKSIRKTQG